MEEYNQEAVDAFAKAGRPIPGQSLTSNPDEPKPFEGPTDFTNFKEALDYTAAELLLEENFMPIVLAMGDGIPVTDLAMQIGYVGFREGKWNSPRFLITNPNKVALKLKNAIDNNKEIIFINYFWKILMIIVKLIPEKIFKRFSF